MTIVVDMTKLPFILSALLSLIMVVSLAAQAASKSSATHTSIFGIKLGAPLALPDCPVNSYNLVDESAIKELCVEPASAANIEESSRNVYFIPGDSPDYLKYNHLDLTIRDGLVQKISVFTNGLNDQDEVLAELTKKFGRPTTLKSEAESNLMGATFQAVTANWKVGADRVLFLVYSTSSIADHLM